MFRIYGLKNQNFQNLELTPEIKVCLLLDIWSGLQKIEEVLGYHGAINAYSCFLDGNFRVKDSELYNELYIPRPNISRPNRNSHWYFHL